MDERTDEDLIGTFPVLRYFRYTHLPEHLHEVSAPFCHMAWNMARNATVFEPAVEEAEVALRKLLESKDAYVRNRL